MTKLLLDMPGRAAYHDIDRQTRGPPSMCTQQAGAMASSRPGAASHSPHLDAYAELLLLSDLVAVGCCTACCCIYVTQMRSKLSIASYTIGPQSPKRH